jgi:hypothetical protein
MVLLSLTACGSQTVQQDDASKVESTLTEKTVTAPVKVEPEPAASEPAAIEPPPVVEVIPHKQGGESPIAVEAIPAKEQSPSEDKVAEQATPVEVPATVEAKPAVSEMVPAESAQVEEAAETKVEPEPIAKVVVPSVEAATGPNTFAVTVGTKQPGHPAYGKGHAMGFLVDGVSGKELVVERGKTYTFDIATDAKHDVYLSKKAIGWGSAPYSAGVEGAYTYKGKMIFKPGKDTPDQLFYACRNHPYMGAVIHVVDPGQTVKIKQRAASTVVADETKTKSAVTESKVKQKLMFAEMMAGAQGAKRVMSSQNDEAKQLVVKAKQLVKQAREKSSTGALPEAFDMASQALKMLGDATALVPGEEELAQLAEKYKTMLHEINDYQKSYQNNVKSLEKKGKLDAGIKYDEKAFAETLAKAESFAQQKNYVHANKLLEQAQTTVTVALHKMLDSKTLVYDLNFETPADEYDYELKRFTEYEDLIPIAIEAKKPAPGAVKLMESFLAKARKRRDEAQSKADAGDYPSAIGMMLQATKTVRRALRMVGVAQ